MGDPSENNARKTLSGSSARPAGLWEAPELAVAFFSFVLHFVWEFVQVPTYAGMAELPRWEAIKLCMSATFGDVGFALTAFWVACLTAQRRDWMLRPTRFSAATFVAVGIVLTVGFEYYYTNVSLRWTYSDLMPLVAEPAPAMDRRSAARDLANPSSPPGGAGHTRGRCMKDRLRQRQQQLVARSSWPG